MFGVLAEDTRIELTNLEIGTKGKCEEIFKSGIQDVRFLEKTLNKMRIENDTETSFLKKQVAQLVNDKIKLQQHVISLTSRVGSAEMEIIEKIAQKSDLV